jgi:hypothetical protein
VGLELDSDTWNRNHAYEDMMSAGWAWLHRDFVMVCEPPTELHLEAPIENALTRRMHRVDGPAIKWADNTCIYFIHGVRIGNPDWIIDPASLTPERIESEPNAEVRRIMTERYGEDRYLQDAGAVLIHEDVEWGKLWRRDIPNDEPLVMVEVLNSSPEPDGSFKTYFLRVDPRCKTVREAIGWTFDLPAEQYAPMIQT